jgi:phage-related protein
MDSSHAIQWAQAYAPRWSRDARRHHVPRKNGVTILLHLFRDPFSRTQIRANPHSNKGLHNSDLVNGVRWIQNFVCYRMADLKPVEFRGSSLDDLRGFPLAARREAGHQIDQVQRGLQPDDWKPMPSVGQGVREIRIRDAAGAFRVIYLAKFADAIYVLHCFQKKTQKTSKNDIELAANRHRELMKELVP